MKKIIGVSLAIAASFVVLAGTTGCQSGWKFSNPFSRAPKATDAAAPDEFDDELAEVDDITPPPENYTVGDSTPKKEKTSLAQKGKYGDESEERAVASAEKDSKLADADESYRTPSYAQDYQTPTTKTALNDGVGSVRQTSADSASEVEYGVTRSVAASSQPYTPAAQNAAATQIYSSNPGPASVAQNGAFPAAPEMSDPFPAADAGSYPIAQVSASAVQQQQQPVPQQPTNVAFNYESDAHAANPAPAAANASDSDPYSNVIYTPQNVSGGFAPGSVLY